MRDSDNSDNSGTSPNNVITSYRFESGIESGCRRVGPGRKRDAVTKSNFNVTNPGAPLEMKHESVKVFESGSHDLQAKI